MVDMYTVMVKGGQREMRQCELKGRECETGNINGQNYWKVAMWVPTMSHCPARRDRKVREDVKKIEREVTH